jgi:hypothetical protein
LGEAKLLGGTITAPKSRYGSIPLSDEISQYEMSDQEEWIEEDTIAYAGEYRRFMTYRTMNLLYSCDVTRPPQPKSHT